MRVCFRHSWLVVLLLTGLRAAPADETRTLAVLYFENNSLTKQQEMDPLRKGLADQLITELGKISRIKVVERNQLQKLLEEMQLAQAGMIDSGSAQEVGKMLGAQNLLFGSYMLMLDHTMRIDVRIVEVESALTIKAEEVSGNPKDLYKLVTGLTAKIAKDLNIKLSKADAVKLATVDNTSFDAALYYAKGLEYEDARDYANAARMYEAALKKNSKFDRARERLSIVQAK
ncbi:MAG: Curli production assembly/transport component CsgG [bacterium ADurb.Bin478]|nr:MAG: Curli production assembly/transport component CsgG [bacterium ADurb.Bin478]